MTRHATALLSRVEDAGLNASAPPQQRWIDGWLVRFSPGKAQRARCVQPVASGRLPIDDKLALAAQVYDEARLPMVVRVTPFAQPRGLDRHLGSLGWASHQDTRVMVAALAASAPPAEPLPRGLVFERLGLASFAQAVGALRGSTLAQREAHAERLEAAPVPFRPLAIRRESDGALLACGQFAREADLVGLYDIFTAPAVRGQGLARRLCARLLALAQAEGAGTAYLQVEGDNADARAVYARLGFADAYAYHYRVRPGDRA
ncbi:MAG TPA: GNAT family N-acetyltransferase [Burkholderiaceae bacterium]|nr:GNAT family N-acetyltransferase [Burkholderiaceae bacterium]